MVFVSWVASNPWLHAHKVLVELQIPLLEFPFPSLAQSLVNTSSQLTFDLHSLPDTNIMVPSSATITV